MTRIRAFGRRGWIALVGLALVAAHCPSGNETPPPEPTLGAARPCPVRQSGSLTTRTRALELYDALITNPDDPEAFENWKALLPQYGDYYVVDGDLLVLGPDLENYVLEMASRFRDSGALAAPRSSELSLNRRDDRKGCWESNERPLAYTVDRASFCGNANQECPAYGKIVEDLATATADWEEACPECNVKFELRRDATPDPHPHNLLFVVRQCEMYPTLGLAFFPGDELERRYVDVSPQAGISRIGRVGILRHELGHVLGYRHEQLDRSSGCFRAESGDWERMTEYDPRSVMHYPCGNAAGENERLTLSPLDRAGHRETYSEVCGP